MITYSRIRKALLKEAFVYGSAIALTFGIGYVLVGCDDEGRYLGGDGGKVIFDNVWVNSKIVDTPKEKARGLMFHPKLTEKESMLFVYDSEGIYNFWMKNVYSPIDIIWIDSNFSIVHIKRNAPPCIKTRCQIYSPPVTAKYVLEVTANFTEKHNVNVGDRVKISFF
ncbi:MAG: DUF192 domain-containing protein [Deltaproteobacteria bacterium]|nr:MAG: DUF192 domain-containing protein [Deltaproteobacteria bacterium]